MTLPEMLTSAFCPTVVRLSGMNLESNYINHGRVCWRDWGIESICLEMYVSLCFIKKRANMRLELSTRRWKREEYNHCTTRAYRTWGASCLSRVYLTVAQLLQFTVKILLSSICSLRDLTLWRSPHLMRLPSDLTPRWRANSAQRTKVALCNI